MSSLAARVGSIADKLKVGALRLEVRSGTVEELFARPEVSTRERLEERGFSEGILTGFFQPFFGGVFFDTELQTSSRQFEFCFRMFSTGDTVLPARGMQSIPEQLASRLPSESLRLGSPVAALKEGGLLLANGERLRGSAVVVATEAPAAARLLQESTTLPGKGTTTLYFSAPKSPVAEPILVLNGEGGGPVNHLAVPSQVAPSYAPAGSALVCANVIGIPAASDTDLEAAVRRQLTEWYGGTVAEWRLLRTYRIPHALPDHCPPALEPRLRPARLSPGLYVCGDWRADASINGALLSGRLAAEAVLADR